MLPDLGLVKLVFISGLVCAATSESVVCPDSSQWSLRTRAFCNSTHPSLNCLYEETTSTFVQFCTTRPDFQRPGYKFIIRGNIDGIECDKNRFQPIKFWTNGSNDCILEKTRCNEPGQVIHDEGDSTSDRTCRCDYTKGFAFVSQRQDCFCDPSLEDCSCFLKSCSKFQVMTPDYNCIDAKDWTGIFKCPVITKTMTTSATTRCPKTPPDMNQSPIMAMVVKKFNALTVTVLIVTTVMLIIVSTTCGKNIKKCCRNLNMTEKELDERYERRREENKKGNLNMTEKELDERYERMREENKKDKMKLMANYREIITNVTKKDMVNSLKTLTENDKRSINLCIGRIDRNKALLDIVIEKGVVAYKEFIGVLRQSNSDLANKIEKTEVTESDYQKEYEDKYENIYNERIPQEVRKFHDGKIQDWKLKDNMIIATTASDYIRDHLTTNNCVVVVGSPGSGKSSILHHVALSFVAENDTEDYEIIPVIVDPSKILEYYNDSRNQIFVIDNLCGKDKVNNQLIDLWKLGIESIYGMINQTDCYEYEAKVKRNKKTKLLISCNNSIFDNDIFVPLKKYLNSFVCELSEFPLTEKERVEMITKYAPEAGKNFTFQDEKSIDNFDFPLLCKLSARKPISEIKKLFRKPLETITNNLKNIQKTKPRQFCAIALCTIFNNEFNEKWLNLKYDSDDIHTINVVNEVCREFNLELKNEREHIRAQFDQDKIEWLSKSGDTYHFVHESIFNIASVICVESYTQCFINHASSSFLAERFDLANLKDGNISLKKTCTKQYFDRLIRDLEHGITDSTFQNIQLKNKKYRKDFIDYCRKRELKVREILGNLKSIDNVKDRTIKRPFCADVSCRKGTFCFDFHSVNNPLIECAWQGYDDMVELLLDMKCDANETDEFGRSPLFVASAKGHIEIVKRLVENEKKENEGNENEGHLKIAENKKRKSAITIRDHKERTSLHIACEEGHKPVIEYLIQEGANISACDVDGNSPLHMACVPGKREVVEFLLKKYTKKEKVTEIENKNNLGQTPIIVASSTVGNDVVELLLQYHANIHAIDKRGFTSLLTASMYGFSKTVQFLIVKGAKILHLDNEGRTALFIACKKGHLDTVKVLIKEGKAEIINECDWHHTSPFYIACSEGRTEIVKVLIENEAKIKADINLCDENSNSPLHVACERGHVQIVQFLLKYGAKMDARDRHDNLPLHVACKVGYIEIVRLLHHSKSYRKCLSLTNQWNETPLEIAQKKGHANIIKHLKKDTQI